MSVGIERPALSIARAFVALRPPEEVLDDIAAALESARRDSPGWRWASREQWHVTLAFLGAVADESALSGALDALRETPEFRIRLCGSGAFPARQRARVAWLGVGEGSAEVVALVRALHELLGPLGFEADRRFRPHLTLARAREALDATPILALLGGDWIGSGWTVREVALYESRLGPAGPSYSGRGAYALAIDGRSPADP
ncbi:MAG: RNA 2',3'-cyclic phosphodiesterase [Acidimicrobiia bacterium]